MYGCVQSGHLSIEHCRIQAAIHNGICVGKGQVVTLFIGAFGAFLVIPCVCVCVRMWEIFIFLMCV
jgi:hypothetical protein